MLFENNSVSGQLVEVGRFKLWMAQCRQALTAPLICRYEKYVYSYLPVKCHRSNGIVSIDPGRISETRSREKSAEASISVNPLKRLLAS